MSHRTRTNPSHPVAPAIGLPYDQDVPRADASLQTAEHVALVESARSVFLAEAQEPFDMAKTIASLVRSHRVVQTLGLPADLA